LGYHHTGFHTHSEDLPVRSTHGSVEDGVMDQREAITADNVGPVVSLLAWIMEAAVIIAVIVKFTLSSMIIGKRHTEDVALFVATVSS
jgi:hypothetical protein